MKRFKLYIGILMTITLIMASLVSYSQVNVVIDKTKFKTAEKEGLKEALTAIQTGDEYFASNSLGGYKKALEQYLTANRYNSENAELNYKIGVCYLTSTEKKKAITFLEKAKSLNNEVSFDILYEMGRAYQVNGSSTFTSSSAIP